MLRASSSTRSRSVSATRQLWIARSSMALFIGLSLALLLITNGSNNTAAKARGVLTDIIAPVVGFFSAPAQFISHYGDWSNALDQNRVLKDENKALLKWQNIALTLDAENHELRQLLNMKKAPQEHNYITAKIIGNVRESYRDSFVVNAGRMEGVRKNQAVVSPNGLVGRIIEVGEHSARILSVTDINSRLPVIAEQAREKGILTGSGSLDADMRFVPEKTEITIGERILTTSDGEVFPAGLLVGEVVQLYEGTPNIQPYVDWDRLEYVRIIAPSAAHITAKSFGKKTEPKETP